MTVGTTTTDTDKVKCLSLYRNMCRMERNEWSTNMIEGKDSSTEEKKKKK